MTEAMPGHQTMSDGGTNQTTGMSLVETGLMEALGEAACVCDAQGAVVWSNELFRAYERAVQSRVRGVCRSAAVDFAQFWGADDGANPWRRKSYRVNWKSRDRSFIVRLAPIVTGTMTGANSGAAGGGGGGLRVAAVIREITKQDQLKRKIAAIVQAGRELIHIDADLVKKVHVADRLKLLEEKVVRLAHELLHFDHFAVRLINPETNKLELVMSCGLPPEATAIELYAQLEGNGISGFVASTGESYICGDCGRDRRYVLGLEQAGSSLTVPLRLFDKVIGVFNVESQAVRAFGETDRQFAEIFANSLAMALNILQLLLVERCETSATATGTMQGEISEPLNDLARQAEWLRSQASLDPEASEHLDQIVRDVESIRGRMKSLAQGQATLLGVDAALQSGRVDPVLRASRILVADNDEAIRTSIADVLQARGCTVTVFDGGQGAIDRLDALHPGEAGFDVVLSDINLGDRTGYDVFAAAKRVNPALPVILMTGFGYDPHHSIVRASQEGLHCVLFKPFQAEKLLEEVRAAVVKKKMSKVNAH